MHMLTLPAPAKLNLFLHITGRRSDGYHLLQTVFQLLDFGDELSFDSRADGVIHLQSDLAGVDPEGNLVVRAARALRACTGSTHGADIRLHKRTPVGAGLGGGSSDAATTLLALNSLWGCGLGIDELARMGLSLGADVPVFVRGRSAWAEGVGEVLRPIELPARWYLVIYPGCPVNTAGIFKDPQLTRSTPEITMAAFLGGHGHNDCEPVASRMNPEIARALAWLAGYGAARMSGTGSAVFAAFEDEQAAQEAAAAVPMEWTRFVALGLDRSPVHSALGL
jgi:4-diphosphocytidyl-2-C-methyl-D-erythritol kinase